MDKLSLIPAAYAALTRDTWFGVRRRRRPARGLLGRAGRLLRAALAAVLLLHVAYFGLVAVQILLYKFMNPAVSSLMVYRAARGTAVKPVRFVPYEKISAGTRRAFIELEDQDFYSHFGVSPAAIKEAMRINKLRGKPVVGGSTITQQLARNLFLNPRKTYLRKYLEAGCALEMEALLGKRRILELYLNYIEFGPGVFGLGQAAQYQFKTDYANLDYEQRVRLAVIITSPLRFNVRTFSDNPGMMERYWAIMGSAEQ